MSMKFEAAVITEKRAGESFNTDSVNINGKVLPREVILNGYKGAGIINDKAYFALVSSFVEGYADAAVVSYEERSSEFSVRGTNPVSVMNEYFRNTVNALNNLKHVSREISIGTIFAGNRNVVIGRSGDTGLYTFRNGELSKVNPDNSMHDDGKTNYGCYSFNDVSVGDIYLLISPGAIKNLTDKDLTDICRISEGSVKKIVNIIKRVASAKPANGGIGVIALKILENDLSGDDEADGFTAVFSALAGSEEAKTETDKPEENPEDSNDVFAPAPPLPDEPVTVVGGFDADSVIESVEGDDITADDEPEDNDEFSENIPAANSEEPEGEKPAKKSKLGKIIITILCLIIIAGVLYAVATLTNIFDKKASNTDADVSGISVGETTTEEESTTEEETSEEESTTEEETTKKSETTTAETTTRRSSSSSTTQQSTTRRSQSTTENTTEATTEAPETEEPGTSSEDNTTEASAEAPTEAPSEAAPSESDAG